jgi:hypothetical protein
MLAITLVGTHRCGPSGVLPAFRSVFCFATPLLLDQYWWAIGFGRCRLIVALVNWWIAEHAQRILVATSVSIDTQCHLAHMDTAADQRSKQSCDTTQYSNAFEHTHAADAAGRRSRSGRFGNQKSARQSSRYTGAARLIGKPIDEHPRPSWCGRKGRIYNDPLNQSLLRT